MGDKITYKNDISYIVHNDDTSDLDHHTCAIIEAGNDFNERLEMLFSEHFDCEIEHISLSSFHKVPEAIKCVVSVRDRGDFNFVLLKSWKY